MFKVFLLVLISVLSISAQADYKVYSSQQKNNSGKVVDVPEPKCKSDVSGLEDGMYVLCSQEDDVEYPVVNGQVFQLTKVIPDDAFDCPLGGSLYEYNKNNKGYAFDDDATKLASIADVNVYTPLLSWMAISISPSLEDGRGSVKYKRADGSTGSSLVRTSAARGSLSSNRRSRRPGDEFSIKAPSSKSTGAYYHSYGSVMSTPAYKACLFNG